MIIVIQKKEYDREKLVKYHNKGTVAHGDCKSLLHRYGHPRGQSQCLILIHNSQTHGAWNGVRKQKCSSNEHLRTSKVSYEVRPTKRLVPSKREGDCLPVVGFLLVSFIK